MFAIELQKRLADSGKYKQKIETGYGIGNEPTRKAFDYKKS